ncbi:hypothetical protein [Fictibacillus gelatini]|uniref:hypothetical protein n=1 Tax=Fictibacillus gelatini TaxID=225985 RepID=UPI0004076369|nr:hypothetical protein [Fictibacillus gelatini]
MDKKKALKIATATSVAAGAFVSAAPASFAASSQYKKADDAVKAAEKEAAKLKEKYYPKSKKFSFTKISTTATESAYSKAIKEVNKLGSKDKKKFEGRLSGVKSNITYAKGYNTAIDKGSALDKATKAANDLVKKYDAKKADAALKSLKSAIDAFKGAVAKGKVYGIPARDAFNKKYLTPADSAYKALDKKIKDEKAYAKKLEEATKKVEALEKADLSTYDKALEAEKLVQEAKDAVKDLRTADKERLTKRINAAEAKIQEAKDLLAIPQVKSVEAVDASTVKVKFEKAVKREVKYNLESRGKDGKVDKTYAVSSVSLNEDKTEATLKFEKPLEDVEGTTLFTVLKDTKDKVLAEKDFVFETVAPEVKEVTVAKDGGKTLVVKFNEKVKETSDKSLKVEVKKDGGLLDVGLASINEDGQVTIVSKDGNAFADGEYSVKVEGVSDLSGKALSEKNSASVKKLSVADKLEITNVGLAPAGNQQIAYKITDNYGVEYTDASKLASGKITAASAKVKSTGVPLDVKIADDKNATFSAANLAENTEVEVSVTYKAGDVTKTATKTLTVGKAAKASAIKELAISETKAKDGSSVDVAKEGFVLGKVDSFKLTANLLDQYNGSFIPSDDESTKDVNESKIVTWTTSNKDVVAFDGAEGETVINNDVNSKSFKVKGKGTAVVTAYLPNGAKAEYTVTVTLAGVKTIAAPVSTDVKDFVDQEITSGFAFTDDNGNTDTLKPLKDDVSFVVKTAPAGASASDLTITNLANDNGTFKGIKVNAKKPGQYTVTMSYGGKTADFIINASKDTNVVKLANVADFKLKKDAAEYKFDVTALNKYDEVLDGPKQADLELTWYDANGQKLSDTPSDITVKLYTADGKEATANDKVAKVGLVFNGSEAKKYTLVTSVKGTIASDSAVVNTVVPGVKSLSISKGITSADKLVVGDTDKQYVDITVKDEDGDVMLDSTAVIKITDTAGNSVKNDFVSYVYKHVAQDGKVSYNDTKAGAVGLALAFDPSKVSKAGTYNVSLEKTVGSTTVKSNIVNVVARESRVLSNVTVSKTNVTTTLGTTASVVVTPVDQYGDVVNVGTDAINLTAANGTVTKGEVTEVTKDGKLTGYKVELNGAKKGTENVTLEVGTGDAKKTVTLSVNVKASGEVSTLKFNNDADNNGVLDVSLHDTVIGDTDTYNTVTLDLTGYDSNKNEVVVKASDFVWDQSGLPSFITFDTAQGTFSVDPSKIGETHTAQGTVKAYQNGQLVGSIKIDFTDAEPTIKSISFADRDKSQELAVGSSKDLSAITLVAKDNYDQDASPAVKASDIKNWASSDTSIATVEDGQVIAKAEGTVTVTGSYKGHVVTFTVKVVKATN